MRKVLPYVVTVLVFLAGVIWTSDQVTLEGERTIYSVNCADGTWSGLRCTGRLVPGDRYRFRASRTRNEVVFWIAGSTEPSGIHRDCTVRDRGNWTCNTKAGDQQSVTNEMAHVTDLYTTLAKIAGTQVPGDRAIDGLDLSSFLFGVTDRSPREGFVFYIKDQLRAIKWRHWKMHVLWETEPNTGVTHLEVPYLFNVVQDPKEETDVNATQGWVRGPMRKLVQAFEGSLLKHPRVPPGAPDDWRPR
jgi:hypothetical protein